MKWCAYIVLRLHTNTLIFKVVAYLAPTFTYGWSNSWTCPRSGKANLSSYLLLLSANQMMYWTRWTPPHWIQEWKKTLIKTMVQDVLNYGYQQNECGGLKTEIGFLRNKFVRTMMRLFNAILFSILFFFLLMFFVSIELYYWVAIDFTWFCKILQFFQCGYKQMDRWTNGQTDQRMDGPMDGAMDVQCFFCIQMR